MNKPTLEEQQARVRENKCPHRWPSGKWCPSLPAHWGPHYNPDKPHYFEVTVR